MVDVANVKPLLLTWFAVISVRLTLLASIAWLAHALVATHRVMANSTIAARTLHTFVDVDLTSLSYWGRKGQALITLFSKHRKVRG